MPSSILASWRVAWPASNRVDLLQHARFRGAAFRIIAIRARTATNLPRRFAFSMMSTATTVSVADPAHSCPWVHFMWPDPTRPISWLTQPNSTHYKWKNLDPTRSNPIQQWSLQFSSIVTYFYTQDLSRTFSQPSINLFMFVTDQQADLLAWPIFCLVQPKSYLTCFKCINVIL